jgi:YfiR/HmsC-like
MKRRCAIRNLLLVFALVLSPAMRGADGPAHAKEMDEYKVKALFLVNFAQFVQWPSSVFEDPGAPLSICVLGSNPFGDALERVVNHKLVDGRPLTVRRVSDTNQASHCQILFIAQANAGKARALLAAMQAASVLTVGEADGFASDGGVINLKLQGGSVRLQVNVAAAEQKQLRISSKLLTLAEIVK